MRVGNHFQMYHEGALQMSGMANTGGCGTGGQEPGGVRRVHLVRNQTVCSTVDFKCWVPREINDQMDQIDS